MITRLVLTLFVIFAVGINLGISHDGAQHEKSENESMISEVELLIVCDKEFSERFDNLQKMINYWAVYMWDVNMRFKTLPGVDISFRVTSLLMINDTADQPFVEEARSEKGTISLDNVWENFGKWVYNHEKNFTSFDVALLVTAAQLNENETTLASSQSQFPGTACLKNDTAEINLSTITFHASGTWGNTCGALEAALGSLLGARDDVDTDCNSDQYLMSNQGCNKKQYMFSECSNDAITKFVRSKKASCLRMSDAENKNVLKVANITHPPSLDDQCAMFTNNKNATAEKDDNRCVLTKCSLVNNEFSVFLRMLSPVDNSPCDPGKTCFRGRCLPHGFQLHNLETGRCLQHSSDRLALSDYPELADCVKHPTPLDEFRVYENGQLGTFLVTPIVIPVMSSNQPEEDECLSIDLFDFFNPSDNLQYGSCRSSHNYLGWNFIKMNGSAEFLLYHKETAKCAGVGSYFDTGVKLYETCDYNDRKMRWTFIKRRIVSMGWFQTVNNYISENTTTESVTQKIAPESTEETNREKEPQNADWKFKNKVIGVLEMVFFVCVVFICCVYAFRFFWYSWKKEASNKVHYYAALNVEE